MTTKSQSTTEETSVNVHALTVFVCQDCIDLKGVMCNNAECVFCRRTMVEVQQLLDAMLLCPIVDGKRLILVGDAVTNEDSHISPASAAPVVDDNEAEPLTDAEVDAWLEAHKNDSVDPAQANRVEWLFRKKLAASIVDKAAEWLRSYDERIAQGGKGAQDMERLYGEEAAFHREVIRAVETLALEPSTAAATAAPVDHASIPLTGYERMLTIEWDKYNARRHELIKAEQSRVLSESEVLELFELQWLARIKQGYHQAQEARPMWNSRKLASGKTTDGDFG